MKKIIKKFGSLLFIMSLFFSISFAEEAIGLTDFADFEIQKKDINILFNDEILGGDENINIKNIYIIDDKEQKVDMNEFALDHYEKIITVDFNEIKLQPNKIYKLYVNENLLKEDGTKLGVELIYPFKLAASYSNVIEVKNKALEEAIREEFSFWEGDLTQGHLDECKGISIHNLTDFENLDQINLLNNLYDLEFVNCDLSQLKDFDLKLKNCNEIDFDNCNIKDFSSFSKNTNLTYLRFDDCNIESFDGIKNLKNIYYLDFANMDLNKLDFDKINSTWDIGHLGIDYCQLNDLSFLNDFKYIKYLGISTDEDVDFKYFKDLTKLERLNMEDATLKNIDEIKDLKDLSNLSLYDCVIDDDDELNSLKNITSLEGLDIVNCDISSIDFIKNLEKLIWLDISHNNIKDLSAISNLKTLKTLNLNENNIENIESIKDLRILEDLDIRDNNISNIDIFKELMDYNELDCLTISAKQASKFKEIIKMLDDYGVEIDIVN